MLPAPLEESASTSRGKRMRRGLGTGLFVAICSLSLAGCFGCGGERQDANEPEGEFPVEIVSAELPAKQRLAQTSELRLTVANVGDETIPDLAVTAFTAAEEEAGSADAEDAEASEGDSATDSQGEDVPEEQLGAEVEQALEEELSDGDDGETSGETEVTEDDQSGETAGAETSQDEQLPQAAGAFSVISQQEGLAIPSRPVWILEQGYPRSADEEAGPAPPGEISGTGGAEAAQTNTFSFGPLEPNATTELIWEVTPVQAGTYTVRYRIAAGLQGKAVAVTQDGSAPVGEFVVRITDVPPQTRVDESGKVVPIKKSDVIGQAGTREQKEELQP